MKLLITTQKVDLQDDILGFMHGWIKEFSRQFDQVTVICLFEGEHDLPENVKVLSLGKNKLEPKAKSQKSKALLRIKYSLNFYKYAWQERRNYDSVFVHMNSEYMLLGAWLWRWLGKKRGLWFAHYRPNWIAKIAFRLTEMIFTSTRKACAFDSEKVKVVGQGIDTEIFKPGSENVKEGKKILFLGRISPIKKIEMLIKAVGKLEKNVSLNIIGSPGEAEPEKDKAYFEGLQKQVKDLELETRVNFLGKIPFREIAQHYQSSDFFVNLTPTGSLDKTTLEAMSCKNVVLVCNQAYYGIFPSKFHEQLIFSEGNQEELEEKLQHLIGLSFSERKELGGQMREIVQNKHSVGGLITNIKNNY